MTAKKTNAIRLLDRESVLYSIHEYEHKGNEPVDGLTVARMTGIDKDRVLKTLVCRGASGQIYIYCIPVFYTLDLGKAARAAKEKSVQMVPVSEINSLTGYFRGGCSPFGMKKTYPTFIDETAELFNSVCVSGGVIGIQVELKSEDLIRITGAQCADLTGGVVNA